MIKLHEKYISLWKKKLNISNYGLLWISFTREVLAGLLIYRFLIA